MTDTFRRAAVYGEPVFAGPVEGPLWRHTCGNITSTDLMDDRGPQQPWNHECSGCRGTGRQGWLPLYVYTGETCDQCDGAGWVPMHGHVNGALGGYQTVTPCTACGATGIASAAQLAAQAPPCTARVAVGCPNHGRCRCREELWRRDPGCPLHAPDSTHDRWSKKSDPTGQDHPRW